MTADTSAKMPTPETDAEDYEQDFVGGRVVQADFARKLERQRDALRECLRERVFWTANIKTFDRQGYTLFTDHDTAIRDINYRNCRLYETADLAIDAALEEMMQHLAKQS